MPFSIAQIRLSARSQVLNCGCEVEFCVGPVLRAPFERPPLKRCLTEAPCLAQICEAIPAFALLKHVAKVHLNESTQLVRTFLIELVKRISDDLYRVLDVLGGI